MKQHTTCHVGALERYDNNVSPQVIELLSTYIPMLQAHVCGPSWTNMQANHAMRLVHEDKQRIKTRLSKWHCTCHVCGSYMENNFRHLRQPVIVKVAYDQCISPNVFTRKKMYTMTWYMAHYKCFLTLKHEHTFSKYLCLL